MADQPAPLRRIITGQPAEWQRPAAPAAPAGIARPPLPRQPDAPPRWRMRWHFVAFGSIIGILTAAIVGMVAVLAFRALLSHDDRATTAYTPADSYAYVAVNTDRTSRAWLDAWTLAEDLGIDDELSDLPSRWAPDSENDSGLWEEIVKPAIGQEIGLAVWPGAAGSNEPHAAGIVLIGDLDAANAAIPEALEDAAPLEATYRDVTYFTNVNGEAAGIVDDALVVATTAAAFEDVVDARRDGALDAVGGFSAAAGRAAADPLVFVYLDAAAVGEALTGMAGDAIPAEVPMTQFDLADWGDVTITLTTDGDALRLSTLTSGRPASFPTATGGANLDAFSAEMPADAFMFLAGHDLYASVWQPITEQMAMTDEALGDDSEMGLPPMDLAAMLGFDIEDGLLAHLRGNYALALGVEGDGTTYGGALRFMADVDDPDAVAATVDDVAAMLTMSGAPVEQTPGGFAVSTSGVEADVTVDDSTLVITASYLSDGTSSGALADDPGFRRAVDALPENATFAGYIAVDPLLALVPGEAFTELDPEARAVFDAIDGLAYSSGVDGDGTRSDVLLLLGAD